MVSVLPRGAETGRRDWSEASGTGLFAVNSGVCGPESTGSAARTSVPSDLQRAG